MTEPALNRSRRDSVRMVHRCKRLAEPMQYPVLAALPILAGHDLAIQRACAMTAIESSRQCSFLQHPQEVTFGIPLGVGENQPANGMHCLTHLECN